MLYRENPIQYIHQRFQPSSLDHIGSGLLNIPNSRNEKIVYKEFKEITNRKVNYVTLLNKCKDIIKRIEKNSNYVNEFLDDLNDIEEKFDLKLHPYPDMTTNKGSPKMKRFKSYIE